jgi:hypothetical protein
MSEGQTALAGNFDSADKKPAEDSISAFLDVKSEE